ncbi:MAG: glycosyltransferase family 4 protein [Pseudomonadota bacterium]
MGSTAKPVARFTRPPAIRWPEIRVAIIGPIAPFRSGIARHTTALARALARRQDVVVKVFSFDRLYPKWAYPGESEKDDSLGKPAELDTDYTLDTLNPLTWRRTTRACLAWCPDLVVIPAWSFVVAPALGTIAQQLRANGVPVTMIVHNAQDHEAAAWKTALSRFQLRKAQRFVTHNTGLQQTLATMVPGRETAISPHPVYDDFPKAMGTLPRRAGIELLFFGLLRPYKGLDIALKALARVEADVHLTVAGEFWDGRSETEELIQTLGLEDRVELLPRYVADAEAAELFHRADVLLAPYRSVTGSGVVAMAQWYGLPVVASDLPGFAEAIRPGETGWLVPPEDVDALAKCLGSDVTPASVAAMAPAIDRARDRLSWAQFARVVIDGVD